MAKKLDIKQRIAYWMKRFGGDSSIVGRQVRLDERPVTVIGVLQPAPWSGACDHL